MNTGKKKKKRRKNKKEKKSPNFPTEENINRNNVFVLMLNQGVTDQNLLSKELCTKDQNVFRLLLHLYLRDSFSHTLPY